MKKPNPIVLFVKYLFRVLVVLALMFAIALGSFQGVSYYLKGEFYNIKELTQKAGEVEQVLPDNSEDDVMSAKIDQTNTDITMFILESNDSGNKYITLNMRNTENNIIDVILIPLRSQFTVSKKLMKKLQKDYAEFANPVGLADVVNVYGEEACDQIREIFEDALQINISGYDKMEEDQFEKLLKLAGPVTYNLSHPITYRNDKHELCMIDEGYQKLTPDMAKRVLFYKDGTDHQESNRLEKVSKYLEVFLPQLIRNNSAKDLAEKYEGLVTTGAGRNLSDSEEIIKACNDDSFYVRILQGSESDGIFTIDSQKAALQISGLIKQASGKITTPDGNGGAPQESGVTNDNGNNSKTYSIELFNAAYVQGIAGSWEGYLESEGYTISMISNYNDGPLSQTRILVAEEGMGQELLQYFPDAEIEVGSIDTGGDIRVYIGTDSTEVPLYTSSNDNDESDNDDDYSFDSDSE